MHIKAAIASLTGIGVMVNSQEIKANIKAFMAIYPRNMNTFCRPVIGFIWGQFLLVS